MVPGVSCCGKWHKWKFLWGRSTVLEEKERDNRGGITMLMDIIKARHSIRKYTDEQISREDLEKILEAGNYAPNAGGGQRSMMVAIHNKELAAHVGKMNMANF